MTQVAVGNSHIANQFTNSGSFAYSPQSWVNTLNHYFLDHRQRVASVSHQGSGDGLPAYGNRELYPNSTMIQLRPPEMDNTTLVSTREAKRDQSSQNERVTKKIGTFARLDGIPGTDPGYELVVRPHKFGPKLEVIDPGEKYTLEDPKGLVKQAIKKHGLGQFQVEGHLYRIGENRDLTLRVTHITLIKKSKKLGPIELGPVNPVFVDPKTGTIK